MTTFSINLTDEQKDFLNNYAKDKNTNITDLIKIIDCIKGLKNIE